MAKTPARIAGGLVALGLVLAGCSDDSGGTANGETTTTVDPATLPAGAERDALLNEQAWREARDYAEGPPGQAEAAALNSEFNRHKNALRDRLEQGLLDEDVEACVAKHRYRWKDDENDLRDYCQGLFGQGTPLGDRSIGEQDVENHPDYQTLKTTYGVTDTTPGPVPVWALKAVRTRRAQELAEQKGFVLVSSPAQKRSGIPFALNKSKLVGGEWTILDRDGNVIGGPYKNAREATWAAMLDFEKPKKFFDTKEHYEGNKVVRWEFVLPTSAPTRNKLGDGRYRMD